MSCQLQKMNNEKRKLRVLYLSFGSEARFHLQTYFAVVSALNYVSKDIGVAVYTDRPEFYQRFVGRVDVVALAREKLEEWIAGTNYIYRAKIQAVRDCARRFPCDYLLFIDSDTVVTCPFDGMIGLLASGKGLMYVHEGHPSAMHGAPLRMWKAMKGRRIGLCTISMRHDMWNSGVIGLPISQVEPVARLALELCDAIVAAHVRCFTAEQYAFSIAMQEFLEVCPAKDYVAHYWGNKEDWLAMAVDFVQQAHFENLTLDEEIARFPFASVGKLPLYVKRSNTRRRIIVLLNKLFPDKVRDCQI